MKNIEESNSVLNVLCLEDVLKDAELLNEMLVDADFHVKMDLVSEKKEYVDLLKKRDYDIILSDNKLPGMDAFAALKLALALKPEIPFICVSGTIGEEKAVELLKLGASDYVLKDRLGKLVLAVQRALKDTELRKKRKQAEEGLKNMLDELITSNKELAFQIKEKEKREEELVILNTVLKNQISMRNQSDQALKESNEKYSEAFRSSPYAITISSLAEGRYIEVNDAFVSNSGFTRKEALSNSLTAANIWVDLEERSTVISALLSGKNVEGNEFQFRKKNGEIMTGLFSAKILYINKEPYMLSSVDDITERKLAESELIKAKEKAEESDRLKSAFLTNMSHEIRTPMNGILGFAELLKEPNLSSDELQDYIQAIQISGARMLNTINSIVDISKIESGLIQIDIRETDINEIMEFTYKFFKPETDIKGLQLILKNSLPDEETIIKTDNEKVYGILTNLVRNAIKFTFDGSIEFGYVLKSDSEPGSTEKSRSAELEFFVRDTGVGIPDNQKELIFERFRQGSESHDRGFEGSGLGLSITKSYVTMLGGKIWVESEEDIGSTFYFTIPYNTVPKKEIELLNIVAKEHEEAQLNSLKILIVEDDEISYSLLTRMLQDIKKTVLHAVTGVEAVEACRNNPDIDLVLMDIRMPKMDGNEATRQIRQFNKDVIIIAQTAYALEGDSNKALEAGCNDYISKPIDRNLLIELITKHIDKLL